MKNVYRILCALLCACLLLTGCSQGGDTTPDTTTTVTPVSTATRTADNSTTQSSPSSTTDGSTTDTGTDSSTATVSATETTPTTRVDGTKTTVSATGTTRRSGTTKTTVSATRTTHETTSGTRRTNKTTTTKKTTASVSPTTNHYTADQLFFPIHDPSLPVPKDTALAEVSLSLDEEMKRVRIQLPKGMTVRILSQEGHSYAAIFRNDLQVGRLVPNFVYPDVVMGQPLKEKEINGVTVQTMRYTAGADIADTYYGFAMPHDTFFYTLEISADYISQKDFATCLSSLRSFELLERNNRLESRNKKGLRIAIAGNSFIGTSQVAQQLEAILNANRKDATVAGYSFPNISIALVAADPQITRMLCGGDFDVLFLSGAYWADDVTALGVIEKACHASGTELVLFPAHNEGGHNAMLAYRSTTVKLAYWKDMVDRLQEAGIPESDLIMYDGPRHSKPIAGYCGAVMIYGMLYESAPYTARIGADYSGLSVDTAQLVEDLTMDYIRPYFE